MGGLRTLIGRLSYGLRRDSPGTQESGQDAQQCSSESYGPGASTTLGCRADEPACLMSPRRHRSGRGRPRTLVETTPISSESLASHSGAGDATPPKRPIPRAAPTAAVAVCVWSESPLGHSFAPVFLQVRDPGRCRVEAVRRWWHLQVLGSLGDIPPCCRRWRGTSRTELWSTYPCAAHRLPGWRSSSRASWSPAGHCRRGGPDRGHAQVVGIARRITARVNSTPPSWTFPVWQRQ
jgi:hypothetical protein